MIIEMNVEKFVFDRDSVVVNFDGRHENETDITYQSGYVRVSKDIDCFTVTIINAEGDVISETEIPFNFIEC